MSNEESVKLVSVGCKLPHGLHLDLKSNDGPVRVTLKGANDARIVGGYGITENVSAEFMQQWLKKNARHQAVVNGLIFLHADTKGAEATAKERGADSRTATGLEAIDPIKNGMLRGANGEDDKAALAKYHEQRSTNPDRNRQRAE